MKTNRTQSGKRSPQRRKRRAFTLIEMVVVVTIIAILATLIVPRLWSRIFETKKTAAQNGCKQIATQVSLYLLDIGQSAPKDGIDLDVLLLPPDQGGGKSGPYLQKEDDLLDPWGNPYSMRVPGVVNYDFDIVSFGADGQPGGEGEDADITH